MPQTNEIATSTTVSQNNLNAIKPYVPEAPINKGDPSAAVRPAASQESVELSSVKRQQVNAANSFMRDLQDARSIFQASASAFQEIREALLGADTGGDRADALKKAGEKSLRLLESITTVRADQELGEIKRKLASTDKASFADVVDAVAVLAKIAKGGMSDGTNNNDLQRLAEAVSLVNEALNKTQTRLETLTKTASQASTKAEQDLNSREGIAQVASALSQAIQGSKEDAMKAQANIKSELVARILKDTPG